jgi:5'-nucleotidase
VLKDRTPDLVVSGINHGSNASVNVLYSGTMSAAIEGAIEGLPSIGFSLCDFSPTAHFAHVRPFIKKIAQAVLQNGIPKGIALNVNIPAHSERPIEGIKICQQANAKWQEDFDERQDPYGRHYYWMVGNFVNFEKENQATDEWALAHNYVSVVPCQYNLTAADTVQQLKTWNL